MAWSDEDRPKLRPVEAFRIPDSGGATIGLRDRSGLSHAMLSMSAPALQVLALMDGTNTCAQIRRKAELAIGQTLAPDTLDRMLGYLEQVHFLEGPGFEAFYRQRQAAYRDAGVRSMRDAETLGIHTGASELFEAILGNSAAAAPTRVVRGIIAPHLDYPRGRPCYAEAYGALRGVTAPDRVVILGTNHFGRGDGVVATANDFSTPLGIARTDRAFLERLENRCGELRTYELDHLHEHSVELQVAWLQFIFGSALPPLVAILCPDPCRPTGAAGSDGDGVGVRDFGRALGALVGEDKADTLLVAGADLSHVGAAFGDDRPLDDAYLSDVRASDTAALNYIAQGDPEGFLDFVVQRENETNICSLGCIFALATALPDASATILRYHQAVDQRTQTCVTCAAVAFA